MNKKILIFVLAAVLLIGAGIIMRGDKIEYVKVIEHIMSFDVGSMESNIERLEEEGNRDIVVHDDGYVSYMMPKEEHEEMIEELRQAYSNNVVRILESGEYPYIQAISHNSDFTLFDINVDSAKYPKVGYSSRLIDTLGSFGDSFGLKNGVENSNIGISIWSEKGEELIHSTSFHFDY